MDLCTWVNRSVAASVEDVRTGTGTILEDICISVVDSSKSGEKREKKANKGGKSNTLLAEG